MVHSLPRCLHPEVSLERCVWEGGDWLRPFPGISTEISLWGALAEVQALFSTLTQYLSTPSSSSSSWSRKRQKPLVQGSSAVRRFSIPVLLPPDPCQVLFLGTKWNTGKLTAHFPPLVALSHYVKKGLSHFQFGSLS